MARGKTETLMTRVMAEKINFGGVLATRAEVARCMTTEGQPAACIDRFAFASRAVAEAEQTPFRAQCACGCRMLSVFPLQIPHCPICRPEA